MSRPDPFITAAVEALEVSLADLRAACDALPVEGLNWRPPGAETNSIAVLATHVLHSSRSWLSASTGAPLPERDREAEFLARSAGANELLAFVDDFGRACLALLQDPAGIDWEALRPTHRRPTGADEEVTGAYALLHAIEHLREHVGHISLTRQLWLTAKEEGK